MPLIVRYCPDEPPAYIWLACQQMTSLGIPHPSGRLREMELMHALPTRIMGNLAEHQPSPIPIPRLPNSIAERIKHMQDG